MVEGRASPGGLRHSLASPTALAPLNQLLHLRVVAYLEEKAALEESAGGAAARMALPTLLRRMAALERQLKQALHAAPRSIELKVCVGSTLSMFLDGFCSNSCKYICMRTRTTIH